ncbi:cytochrome P450 [Aspergillus undulatus]|uniref:cytochrome P450 n=1 Tax=Aspergillus undulatus TaxID=1810928 RepID=UPI003CCCF444
MLLNFNVAPTEFNDIFKILGAAVCLGLLLFLGCPPAFSDHGLPIINGGTRFPFLSYKTKLRFLQRGKELVQEGYAKVRLMQLQTDNTNVTSSHQRDSQSRRTLENPLTAGPMTQKAVTKNWHEAHLAEGLMRLVVRVSARAFLGPNFSHDERWIDATVGYTTSGLISVYTLHLLPQFLHPILQWVLPSCREARAYLKQARALLQPELDRRETTSSRVNDSMTWVEEASAGSPYDPVAAQLWLSFVASDSTADFLTKLLDSAMKESQRLSPVSYATMSRQVRKTIKLTNGIELPLGSKIAVSTASMRNPSIYPEPDRFNGYRFLDMESLPEASRRFVSTSESHMGFGHGAHACPGRFFAAHELRIILCHILTKYDFKVPDRYQLPSPIPAGFFVFNDPDLRMLVRRRKDEISL